MENLEEELKKWLMLDYSLPERFGLLRSTGKTWEKEMKEKSSIPIFRIEQTTPPNFTMSTIKLLDNKYFESQDIGITFQAVFEEPDNDESDEEGLVYRIGRCKGLIKGENALLDSKKIINSIAPIDFVYEKIPEWIDKGDYYDIGNWIDYWMRYDHALPVSIMNWFDVDIKTVKGLLEDRTISKSKSVQEKWKNYKFKYNHEQNIAEKMFPLK